MKKENLNEIDPLGIKFWKWFLDNEKKIISLFRYPNHTNLVNEISRSVKKIDDSIGWEIGPGKIKKYFFALSPNGDKKLLQLIRSIISLAPNLSDWEIYAGKPRKEWNRKMEIKVKNHFNYIDFTDWKYALVAFNNRSFFDITFIPKKIDDLDSKNYVSMGILYAESELGEELFLEKVGQVNVELIKEHLENETPAEYLFDHIKSL